MTTQVAQPDAQPAPTPETEALAEAEVGASARMKDVPGVDDSTVRAKTVKAEKDWRAGTEI